MDKETREFLTKQFESINAKFDKIDARFEAMDARFDTIDARFESMDARFEAMDARLESMDTRFEKVDARFDGIQQHIDAKAAENRRHFEVVTEGLRSDIKQIAEGHQVMLDGQTRIVDRVEEVERELGAMIKFS